MMSSTPSGPPCTEACNTFTKQTNEPIYTHMHLFISNTDNTNLSAILIWCSFWSYWALSPGAFHPVVYLQPVFETGSHQIVQKGFSNLWDLPASALLTFSFLFLSFPSLCFSLLSLLYLSLSLFLSYHLILFPYIVLGDKETEAKLRIKYAEHSELKKHRKEVTADGTFGQKSMQATGWPGSRCIVGFTAAVPPVQVHGHSCGRAYL